MTLSPTSTTPPLTLHATQEPFNILRTETVLSRFPIHNLTKHGRVTIHLHWTNAQRELDCRWDVSYNDHYGQPGPLAYKLDTLVINQRLDTLPRPLPRVLKLGSLRHVGTLLGLNASGRQQAHLKTAFHQNASAYIVAKLRYRGRDGTERRLEAGFTRYSVLFTGEPLPDGTPADAIYLVLSEPYWEVLNHAPVRPLDYTYLKALPPTAQRFYEIVSYKIFAALQHRAPCATLRYADYCQLATQHRGMVLEQVQKHMYKVHQPHLASGYLDKVRYDATTDADGQPDWLLHYTPGPRAHTEYTIFKPQPGADRTASLVPPSDADPDDLGATLARALPAPPPSSPAPQARQGAGAATGAREAPPRATPAPAAFPCPPPFALPEEESTSHAPVLLTQAQALVAAFYQRFHGRAPGTAHPKELAHATQLLEEHGEAKAHFLLTYAQQTAPETAYQPKFFGGILPYLPEALAAYDAQARQAAQRRTQQAAARERRRHERYLAWQQEQCAQLRAALPSTALMALEDAQRARLRAAGTALVALDIAVRVAIDNVLAAQAQLPTFEVWRQQEAAC